MNSGHDDYQSEPIRGLPEKPPPGEHILWQGAPNWPRLAVRVFHLRKVAIYFAALIAWRAGAQLAHAGHGYSAIAAGLSLLPVALIGLSLLASLAWLSSRTTVYTITNRRVVLRIGVALPTAINIPFCAIGAAGLRIDAGGYGDIPLTLAGADRMGYVSLWPHVRPWRLNSPEPLLRSIPDARRVAALLGAAVHAALPATVLSPPIAATGQADNENARPAAARAPTSIPIAAPLGMQS
jgi:hypothetical protein